MKNPTLFLFKTLFLCKTKAQTGISDQCCFMIVHAWLFIYALEFLIRLTFDVTQNYCIAYSMTIIICINFEVLYNKLLI